jgi:acyl-CoA synthetase (AMP-forming)/AMP-acid ligase II
VRRVLGEVVSGAKPPLGCRTLEELPDGGTSARPAASQLALIQFSSGTTREPKPVALSQAAVLSQTALLNGLWPDSDEVTHSGVSWLPLYHDMGLIGCVLPALERPGTLTLIPPEVFVSSPSTWLRAISTYRATISPAPNFGYSLCAAKVRDDELEGVDLSSWRLALNGAETAVPEVMRAFAARFARWGFRSEALTPVYGLSEASLALTFSSIERPFASLRFDRRSLEEAGIAREDAGGREIASVGAPLPSVRLRIVSPEGSLAGDGVVGEVECRSPSLMDGYFDSPQETAAAFRDGWLRTGDLGFTWRGELYLTGRARDILLLRGRNYPPEDVERAAEKVSGVRSGCVVALTHLAEGSDGERLLVFVEGARGVLSTEYERIGAECSRVILQETGLAPQEVVVVPPGTLPRTSSGKMRRRETLRLFLAGRLKAPTPVTGGRMALARVRSTLGFLHARLSTGGDGKKGST